VESEILEITPSRSKPNQAVVTVRSITLNQNGEQVQVLTSKILAFKRKSEAQTPD
jgi:acyl dehydratase